MNEEVESSGAHADPVIGEARKRWNQASEWESEARTRFVDDLKFSIGDSENGFQWPNEIRRARDVAARPCLTMNIIRQHNLMISNEARKNKSSIKYVALGNGATQQSANMFADITRRIEYISNAQAAYTIAREFQISGGIGWWRVVTDYAGDDTFDQELFIRPVNDPLTVYMDPDIEQRDGSDAKWAFVWDEVPNDEWKQAYPKFADLAGESPLGVGVLGDDFVSKNHVRVLEYFRKVSKKDQLVSFMHMGQRKTIKKSLLPEGVFEAIKADPLAKTRELFDEVIEWKLIVGERVVDETIWPGKYIPLIRVIGVETKIDGRLDRSGHTRALKDAQRMYNYNASAQVEFVALQGKTPWVAAAKAIEQYETMWNTANLTNHSVLIYNHVDDDNPEATIPPPTRTEPPQASPAYQTGMDTAFNQMMMTSGQWQNQMGMMGNERTGRAIEDRQAQSDTAVFHFQDNYEAALQFTGKVMIDMIPRVYDTRRALLIKAENGVDQQVMIDPAAKQAFQQLQQQDQETAVIIFNPQVGKYDVAASFGPAYGSKREETVRALTLILTQAPALTGIIGDLLLSAMDFDKAEEAAARLRRMVPPQALGQGPTPNEQQLMAKVTSLTSALAASMTKQAGDKVKLVGKNQMRDIDVYKAITDRMKALFDAGQATEATLRPLVDEMVQEAMKTGLEGVTAANANDIDETPSGGGNGTDAPPVFGARKAPDGQWYLLDPSRRGKYLHVGEGAGLVQQHAAPAGQ